jgi:hypothetical protein
MESPFYTRAPISLIAEGISQHNSALFIGGLDGARDLALLRTYGISIVINCAVNLDINVVSDPIAPEHGALCAIGCAEIRYYKLGLVDDSGNPETMMLGAYYILLGALNQRLPKRGSYPFNDGGNVLINCRAGRSRSVALAALFLHKQQPHFFPTLDEAIQHIREKRELRSDEWFETPKPVLYNAAKRASHWIDMIEGGKTGEGA